MKTRNGDDDSIPPLTMDLMPSVLDADGQPSSALKRKYTKSEHYKQRRRHDRFNGMSEDEVRTRTLPDHLASNLDVVIVSLFIALFIYLFLIKKKFVYRLGLIRVSLLHTKATIMPVQATIFVRKEYTKIFFE